MSRASDALLSGFGSIALSAAIGYVLYKAIAIKGKLTKPSDYGRNWLAWTVLLLSIAMPMFLFNLSGGASNAAAAGVVVVIAYGSVAFGSGWLYGKFKGPILNKTTAIKSDINNLEEQSNSTNKKKPMQKSLLIIAIIMLLVAIFPLPYNYYPVLRVVVTASALFAAFYFFDKDDIQSGVVLVLIALLWNPILPIYLSKALWIPLDIVAAIYMYIASKKIT